MRSRGRTARRRAGGRRASSFGRMPRGPELPPAGDVQRRRVRSGRRPAGETQAPAFDYGQAIPAEWWALFRSDRLDDVLRRAIAANHTLAAASFTLAQAREAIVAARSGYYPHVDFGASFRRGASGFGAPTNLFALGPTVSYSIDAFGETRRQVEQASALAERQSYELAAAYLALTGSSVTEAITIAAARLEIATVEDIIKNDQKDLDLTQRAFEAGRVARSDVLVVEAELEQDKTLLPTLHQQLQPRATHSPPSPARRRRSGRRPTST